MLAQWPNTWSDLTRFQRKRIGLLEGGVPLKTLCVGKVQQTQESCQPVFLADYESPDQKANHRSTPQLVFPIFLADLGIF